MSKTLRHYECNALEADGEVKIDFDPQVPLSQKTVTGDRVAPDEFQIAAGSYAVAWDASVTGYDFALLLFALPADGFCELWYKVDTPTSSTDKTPSGSNVRWRQYSQSCVRPAGFDTPLCRINPTLATDAGDSGGLPAAMGSGSTVDGRIYKVVLKNTGASTVVVRRTLID